MTFQPSIRLRLTVWYSLALVAGLSLFGGAIWLSMRTSLDRQLNATLADRAHSLEVFFEHELATESLRRVRGELDEFCKGLPLGISVEIHDSAHALVYASPFQTQRHRRIHTETAVIRNQPYEIRVTGSTEMIHETLESLQLLLFACTPIVILIAACGGYWLSRRALRPVDAITQSARNISIDNLSQRLAVAQTGDELQRLSETWNSMLGRLESAVHRLSQFTADASHELRTPLAVIRATAEVAARKSRPAEAYRISLEEVVV
jgi:methyl-accepting chemotaxis protein